MSQTLNEQPQDEKPCSSTLQRIVTAFPYALTAAAFLVLAICVARGEEPFNISLEDGLMEWGTIFFFMLCALLAAVALRANRETLTRPQKWFLVCMMTVMLLGTGEELSWGQRIFDWNVPEIISAEREGMIQAGHRDTAVHNLSFKSKYVRFSLGGLLFGIVLLGGLAVHGIWLPKAYPNGNRAAVWLVDRLGVFVPAMSLGLLVTIAATLLHYSKPLDGTDGREYKECVVPAVYAFMMLGVYFPGNRAVDRRMRAVTVTLCAAWVVGSVLWFMP